MGIKQLMKLLDEEAPGCYKETEKTSYMGRTVAIDASMQMYAFLVMVRTAGAGGAPAQHLMNEAGEVTSHISGFFYRTINLLQKGLKPVFVFDGKAPELKSDEISKRKEAKAKAEADLQKAQEAHRDAEDQEKAQEEIEKASKRTTRVTREHNEDVQKLLRLMGLPIVLAPGEAEAQCAELCAKGKVFAAATEDMDALTFGAPILLRRLTLPDSQNQPVVEIHLDKVLAQLELTMDQFIDLCILCGCDYCSSIKGIGPKKALKYIRENKTLEKVLEVVGKEAKYDIPTSLTENLDRIREIFRTPAVHDGKDLDFKFEAVQKEELLKFLVESKGFDEKRVKAALERLEKSKAQTSQSRLETFFKPKPGAAGASSSVGFKRKAGAQRGKGAKRGHVERAVAAEVERVRASYALRKPKWIVYPSNKIIRTWDGIMLLNLFILSFTLPYQIGVSGGYYLLVNNVWLAINLVMNTIFFIDTFLYFFRSFHDANGHLLLDLKEIQRRYLRGMFVLNLISCFPSTVVFSAYGRNVGDGTNRADIRQEWIILLKIIEMLKFARLARASTILNTSELVASVRVHVKSSYLQLLWFVFVLALVSHWLACFWVFIALAQAGGFGDALAETDNWISAYVDQNAGSTGLDPIGWQNSFDRYVLALFWSIQTLTSIGYGTLSPYTPLEWWVASILMLLAGICWAYVVGSTVTIASSLNAEHEAFRTRMDAANTLIAQFPARASVAPAQAVQDHDSIAGDKTSVQPNSGTDHDHRVLAERIRDYIRIKNLRGNGGKDSAQSTMEEAFSILGALPPELRRSSALMLVDSSIRCVPYMRLVTHSTLLSVADACEFLDFSPGESMRLHADAEDTRGLFVLRLGTAIHAEYSQEKGRISAIRMLTTGSVIGAGQVLLEQGHPALVDLVSVGFLTFTEMVFVPRHIVLLALDRSLGAWKQSARWLYLREALRALPQLQLLSPLGKSS
ncbi:Flap endonuclease 1 [Hondaea fermentalgiana]|uniref:Flap endonuclease 1 n=1 Tax=Hondaea fermentalgiana TaxID=2315210 RepID=A0A2R5GV21_9STRA|nr:Flap endonuclease 1 [Hondaea fermentalgiana]|eukprot:GBG31764.1 Flap endonuclease 1 [Hondaea fermentalgiana]